MATGSSINALENIQNALSKDEYISFNEGVEICSGAMQSLKNGFLPLLLLLLNFRFTEFIANRKLRNFLNDFEAVRANHNEEFIEKALVKNRAFFDDIEGRQLDDQQRRAIVADEDNTLVIAGAGSGKTTTIVGKIQFLVEKLGKDPAKILPISFTNKSATDMKRRIAVRGVEPMTFHKFGLTALQMVEQKKPSIFDESKEEEFLRATITELSKDDDYLENLTNFFIHYIKIQYSEFDFESLGDYIQYLKDQNFVTYKKVEIPVRGKITFRNEVVKSVQECIIANFLLFNRVDYEYERDYEYDLLGSGRTRKYRPDFTIFQGGKTVYLEHFGIDRENNVPPFFAGPNETYEQARGKYLNSIDWKRRTHAANGTSLIETYSYEFSEGSLEENLIDRLKGAGIKLDPMTPAEIWEVIKDSGKDEVDGFVSLCKTFLHLMKSNSKTIQEVREKNQQVNVDEFFMTRADKFLDLFEPIFNAYQQHLNDTNQIDFDDMIVRATEYISEGKYIMPLDYVVVDEFQDLSVGRYNLLIAIRQQNPRVKFYCVGDDWQSIFRFAGSDIALFRDFDTYFGYTYKAKIETTYRFNDPLIALSTDFILKNPNQTPKDLRAISTKGPTSYSVIESESYIGDDTEALLKAVEDLRRAGMNSKSEVLLIGRYNFDLKRIQNRNKQLQINFIKNLIKVPIEEKGRKTSVDINFITAHKSKGLEADYTIIINCNSGKYGFPSGRADDPILNLLLSSADQFENGEERRLFYVALTRTKNHVAIITDRYRKSKFIKEIQDENGGRERQCPRCLNGELVPRGGRFLGCTNYPYGCRYSEAIVKKPVEKQKELASGNYYPEDDELPSILAPGEPLTEEHFFKKSWLETRQQSEQPVEPSPKTISTKVAPLVLESVSATKLTKSEMNRLSAFIDKPEAYAFSDKGIEKVQFLKGIQGKFNPQESQQFVEALTRWDFERITKRK